MQIHAEKWRFLRSHGWSALRWFSSTSCAGCETLKIRRQTWNGWSQITSLWGCTWWSLLLLVGQRHIISHVLTETNTPLGWGPLTHFYRMKWPFFFCVISFLLWENYIDETHSVNVVIYEYSSNAPLWFVPNQKHNRETWEQLTCVCVLLVTTLFLTLYNTASNEVEHKHATTAVKHASYTPHSLANESLSLC